MSTTTIDLQRFCDAGEDGRYLLAKPFVRSGVCYATNGHVIVSVPAPGEPDTEGKTPNCEAILPAVDGEWLPWPKVEPCSKCQQTGYVKSTCELCHGSGEHWCDQCEADHLCKPCDGSGESDDLCECRKFDSAIPIDKAMVAKHYVSLVGNLPRAEYVRLGEDFKIRFRFDGGHGAVCGIRNPKE